MAADGFLAAMKATSDALKMSVAERKRRRIADAGVLDPPGREHARSRHGDDPAAAVRPAGRDRLRFRDHLSDRRPAPAAHRRRRDAPRGDPRLQHRVGRILPGPRGSHDAGRDHPDAHARGGDRRARIRDEAARLQGRHVRQRACRARSVGRSQRPRHRAARGRLRGVRHRQRLRLRPGVGEVPRSSASRRPSTAPAATRRCATRRPTSPTTISATSPTPAMPPRRASSWAASPGASRSCASPSSKAASAGRASCSAI